MPTPSPLVPADDEAELEPHPDTQAEPVVPEHPTVFLDSGPVLEDPVEP